MHEHKLGANCDMDFALPGLHTRLRYILLLLEDSSGENRAQIWMYMIERGDCIDSRLQSNTEWSQSESKNQDRQNHTESKSRTGALYAYAIATNFETRVVFTVLYAASCSRCSQAAAQDARVHSL